MFMLICLGADKTTVSVATGNQEFHPLYLLGGNVTNEMRRAHRDATFPLAFLAIPKGMLSATRYPDADHMALQLPASTTTTKNSGISRSSSITKRYVTFLSLCAPA